MSDDTLGSDEQLFDSDTEEVVDDHASDSTDSEEQSEEELEQDFDPLSEVNEEPTTKAEESGQKQLEAFQKKVNAGEIKSPKDLPPAQKWMAKYLTFPAEKAIKNDKESLKKELLEELRIERKNQQEAEEFQALGELYIASTTKAQRAEGKGFYEEFKADGLSKLKALKATIRATNIDLSGREERKKSMRIPSPGRSVKSSGSDFENMPEGKKLAFLESLQ